MKNLFFDVLPEEIRVNIEKLAKVPYWEEYFYSTFSVVQMKAIFRMRKIKGYSKLKKNELVKLMINKGMKELFDSEGYCFDTWCDETKSFQKIPAQLKKDFNKYETLTWDDALHNYDFKYPNMPPVVDPKYTWKRRAMYQMILDNHNEVELLDKYGLVRCPRFGDYRIARPTQLNMWRLQISP